MGVLSRWSVCSRRRGPQTPPVSHAKRGRDAIGAAAPSSIVRQQMVGRALQAALRSWSSLLSGERSALAGSLGASAS